MWLTRQARIQDEGSSAPGRRPPVWTPLVEPVAGGSRDKPHKLTSAEKGTYFKLFVCGYFYSYNLISAGHLKKNMRFRVKM